MKKFSHIAAMAVMLVMAVVFTSSCTNESGDNGCPAKCKAPDINQTFYLDADHDGYGNPNFTIWAATMPYGYSINAYDCNDSDATVYPGAPEIMCDIIDQNCNGNADNDVDADGDSFSYCNGDCNDADAAINPNATEIICNDADENCDNDLGSASTTLYSIDGLDGIMYYYRGDFISYFEGGVSPWLNGFFTFDVSTVDWDYVSTAFLNAYMTGDFQPCNSGDVFYPPEFKLNDMADQYYDAFMNCGCRLEDKLVCNNPADNEQCQYLYDEVLYGAMMNSFTPKYASAAYNHTQTSNWWQAKVTDNYFAPVGTFWTDLDKRYVSVFPDTGTCIHCITNAGCYPYTPIAFAFEDGGNHSGTGNLPYLEVTCQP